VTSPATRHTRGGHPRGGRRQFHRHRFDQRSVHMLGGAIGMAGHRPFMAGGNSVWAWCECGRVAPVRWERAVRPGDTPVMVSE
jgi:hypothetical protein